VELEQDRARENVNQEGVAILSHPRSRRGRVRGFGLWGQGPVWGFKKVMGSGEEGQDTHCGKMRSWMKQMKQKTSRAQAT
jgi:hypothetical protein